MDGGCSMPGKVQEKGLLLEHESSVKRGKMLDKKLLPPLSRAW